MSLKMAYVLCTLRPETVCLPIVWGFGLPVVEGLGFELSRDSLDGSFPQRSRWIVGNLVEPTVPLKNGAGA